MSQSGAGVSSPEVVLGHRPGETGWIADWAEIQAYFARLDAASDRIQVERIGSSVQGRPMIMAIITSAANHARMTGIRTSQALLADPRGVSVSELESTIETQPAIAFIGASLHGNEIIGSQMAMQLAHDLVMDPDLVDALDRVVVLLVPSMNPDGLVITRDWWLQTRRTENAGAPMPWLYHVYAGHNNNRDFFMMTQPETRAVSRVLYEEWFPEVVYDIHQMGNGGARFFVPPFDDPVNPNIDPLLVRLTNVVGAQMALALSAAGKTGVLHQALFDLWWQGGSRTVPARHNMVGILSEAASADFGDAITQEPDDLLQPAVGSMYPEPWPGGEWRPRDIVEYELIASKAIIHLLGRQRKDFVRNFLELGRRQIAQGAAGHPFAYVIPALQRDPGSAAELLRVLRLGGVEVHRATLGFDAGGRHFAAGSHVVLLAQPYRAHAKDLLEVQRYPGRQFYPGGPTVPPYDLTGWTLPLQMGVEVEELDAAVEIGGLERIDTIQVAHGEISGDLTRAGAIAVDPHMNASHRAIHEALREGGRVTFWPGPVGLVRGPDEPPWPPGTAVISGLPDLSTRAERWAGDWGLHSMLLAAPPPARQLDGLRVGLYKPWTGSIDEGWTRWLFEEWSVPFDTIHDARIRSGNLRRDFDAIVVPSMPYTELMEGLPRAHTDYGGGLGTAGARGLREFVEQGGTLVLLDESSEFAVNQLGVRVRLLRARQRPLDPERWYAPGSLLRVTWDSSHPLALGMPAEGAVFYDDSPVFEVESGAADVTVVARYPERAILMSGYAEGEDRVAGLAALVEARVGQGCVVLFGFRPQHRAQPHLTFKPFFNALYRR